MEIENETKNGLIITSTDMITILEEINGMNKEEENEIKVARLKILEKLPKQINDPIDERLYAQLEGYLGIIKAKKGSILNTSLKMKKEFNNIDALYQQMNNFEIDEYGSNYPKEIFDPKGFDTSEYYDALARKQSEQHQGLFNRNTIKPPTLAAERGRKSGWDTVSDPLIHDTSRFNPFLAMATTIPTLNPFTGMNPLSLIAAQNKAFVEKKT